MKKAISYILVVIVGLMSNSCIKNDIPYPHTQLDFLTMEAEEQTGEAQIDTKNRVVTLTFPENVNIGATKIVNYTITEGAEVVAPNLSETINLRKNVNVVLHKYYDTDWVIAANQPIERYMTLANQVGTTTIDVPARRVVAHIAKTADLAAVKVESLKLGPAEVSNMIPNLNGETVDFTNPVSVTVEYFGIKEAWTIYVDKTDAAVTLDRVDAWSQVLWAYGSAKAGEENGFQYRAQGATQWITVPQALVVNDGGSFHTMINNVQETTEYEVRAYSGTNFSNPVTVTTGALLTIPNMMLDEWNLTGKVWNPWPANGTSFWDTGNKGATTLGDSNSIPTDETWNGKPGKCAMLQSKFVGISSLGKLAAGNLFVGQFIKVDGTNGILNFGREFNGRPTRLHGYFKYKTSPITEAKNGYESLKNRPDTANIYMALTDWNQPYEIRTNPKNRQLFDPNSPEVIAYGAVQYGSDVNEFTEFTVNLNYRDTQRVPKYILIVCTASKYGDFFTGGTSSVLWVSNLWFDWSY